MNRSNVLQVIEYVKGSPETMDYGKWGALNPEQRHFIAHLCESWLILDGATNLQTKEIERLNNIIEKLEKWLVEWREMLDCPDFYEEGIIDCINETLTNLKELKGDSSNE